MRLYFPLRNRAVLTPAFLAGAVIAIALLGGAVGCDKPPEPMPNDPVHAGDNSTTRPGRGTAPATAPVAPAP